MIELTIAPNSLWENYTPIRFEPVRAGQTYLMGDGRDVFRADENDSNDWRMAVRKKFKWPDWIAPGSWIFQWPDGNWSVSQRRPKLASYLIHGEMRPDWEIPVQYGVSNFININNEGVLRLRDSFDPPEVSDWKESLMQRPEESPI